MIPKPGKPFELSTSYRPLSVLNCVSKLQETLIKSRLEKELQEGGELHPHQYGFQKGKLTLQAVETVVETWSVLVTRNIKNAFNTASHSMMIQLLRRRC